MKVVVLVTKGHARVELGRSGGGEGVAKVEECGEEK